MDVQSTLRKTALALDADSLGRGDDELGRQLIVNFLRAIAFRDDVPDTIVCYNRGVKLAEQGSPAAFVLEALAEKGSDIVLCGTCVEYFALADRLAVGRVGDMRGIVEVLANAGHIVYV